MSIEMRSLLFSRAELIAATLEFCRREWIAVPAADIERIEIMPGGDQALALYFAVDGPMRADRITLSYRQLIAALSGFCRRHDIPLPRTPEKEIHCENGQLAMQYRIEHARRHRVAA